MKKYVTNIWCAVSVLFIAWFMLSWFEIISKNLSPNPTYSPYNLFTFIIERVTI